MYYGLENLENVASPNVIIFASSKEACEYVKKAHGGFIDPPYLASEGEDSKFKSKYRAIAWSTCGKVKFVKR